MTSGSSPAGKPASRWRPGHVWLARALVILVVAATFANALQNEFVYDDQLVIVDDPAVRLPLSAGLGGLTYRPLRTLSYRLDYALGGMRPAVFHLANLVYHAATGLGVHGLLRAIGAAPAGALVGALVFVVHPLQADAVTYAAGRRDVLCGLFYVLGVVAFLRYRQSGRGLALAATVAAYALAILAKEMAVTMPVACVLVDRWGPPRHPADRGGAAPTSNRRALQLVALVAVGALVLALTYGAHVLNLATNRPWHGGSLASNVATMARVWVAYLQLVLWPARLSVDYSYDAFPVSTSVADPWALASLALLAILAVAAWRSFRRGGRLGLGLAWMAVTLLPVSHLIPFRELMAEHYLYIPMMGVAMVVSELVDGAIERWPERQRWVAAAAGLVVLTAAGRTALRNRDWHDRLTLWSATVAVAPRCVRAQFNLGQAYFERSRLLDAERAWVTADTLAPGDPETARVLATLYHRLAKHDLAAARIDEVLAAKPDDGEALTLAGWIALDGGRPDSALAFFDRALAALPPEKAEGAALGRQRAVATPRRKLAGEGMVAP